MAEFIEVIKHLKRMSESCGGQCNDCALETSWLCNHAACECGPEAAEEAEQIIMKWAAEHPEPAFPMWGKFLYDIGVIDDCDSTEDVFLRLFTNAIPADIAEKLGIEAEEK